MNRLELTQVSDVIDNTDDRVICLTFSSQLSFDHLSDQIVMLVRQIERAEKKLIDNLNIILTDDKELERLNSTYRDHNCTTDVLTFDLTDEFSGQKLNGKNAFRPRGITGEIYISADRVIAQSAEHRVKPVDEYLRLLTHGLLHLCGWTHEDDVSLSNIIKTGDNYIKMVFNGD